MDQPSLNFNPVKLTPQAQRLYERLLIAPITNAAIRDELRLLSYTRRLSDIRQILPNNKKIEKKWLGNGIFEYFIKEVN
jgi:hypothetical protein